MDTLNKLLEIYGPDFDLFGYDKTKYFDIVQPPITISTTISAATTASTKTTTILTT